MSRAVGKAVARSAAEELRLFGNPYYHRLMAELYATDFPLQSQWHWELAVQSAGSDPEKAQLHKQLQNTRFS
jgi:hypothetical protein